MDGGIVIEQETDEKEVMEENEAQEEKDMISKLKRALKDDPLYKYLTHSECSEKVIFDEQIVGKLTDKMLYTYRELSNLLEIDIQKLRNTVHRNEMSNYIRSNSYGESKRPKFDYVNVFRFWMHSLLVKKYNLTPQTIATIAGIGTVGAYPEGITKFRSTKKEVTYDEYLELQEQLRELKGHFNVYVEQNNNNTKLALSKLNQYTLQNVKTDSQSILVDQINSRITEIESKINVCDMKLAELNKDVKQGFFKGLFSNGNEERETQKALIISEKKVLLDYKSSLEKEQEQANLTLTILVKKRKELKVECDKQLRLTFNISTEDSDDLLLGYDNENANVQEQVNIQKEVIENE